jgi:flavin reductase (DIM6/NTAB) family NADH-FMN oxidoreductase RutF
MIIETASLEPREGYKLLTGAVVPRPIAWVSSVSADGKLNLAPFSFFQGVCGDPPTVMISVGRRPDGVLKDTGLNVLETGEFVVNVVSLELGAAMNESSRDYPYGLSEFEPAGVQAAPSRLVRPPRVAEAPIALECRLVNRVNVGRDEGYTVLFGEVVCFHVRDDLYDRGRIDFERLQPLGRLAGNLYSRPGELLELVRPVYQAEQGAAAPR